MTDKPEHEWFDNWNPFITESFPFGTVTIANRFELLTDMWALYDQRRMGYSARKINLKAIRPALEKVANYRILNHAQLAELASCTRQSMHLAVKAMNLPLPETQTNRGRIEAYQVDYLRHLVRKMGLGEIPTDEEIAALQLCGDRRLMSVLTGIPEHVIKTASDRECERKYDLDHPRDF